MLYPKTQDFFKYVENQWIRGVPIQIWNVYRRDGIARTTNTCEGWNSNRKRQLKENNRNLWGVLTALKIQERNQKVKFRKSEQDEAPPPQRRRYRDFNLKTQRLIDAFENNLINVFCYWTNICLICRSV